MQNQFNGSIDNYGANISDATFGVSIPAHASANTKGADTSVITGATVTDDVYGIHVAASGGNGTGVEFGFLADLLIDPAGGTAWSVLVNNLLFNSPGLVRGLYRYFFPLKLKAGTSIGMRQQCSTGAQAMRVGIKLMTKPSRPELLRVGHKVETIGAVTATSNGAAITPGSNAIGAWASVGTLTGNPWFWQMGCRAEDTTMAVGSMLMDLAIGDATFKRMAMQDVVYINDTVERVGKDALGAYPPYMQGVAGETVYARAHAASAPDTGNTVVAYGVI